MTQHSPRFSPRFRRIPPPSPGSHAPSGGKDSVLSLVQNSRQRREDKSFNGDLETVSTTPGEPEGCAGESRADLPVGQQTSRKNRWRNDEDGRGDGACWRPLRSSHTERSLMAKRRVVRMLFVLVAEFFICWSPLFIVNLLSLYIPRQVYAALGSFGVSLVQLLAYLSSCCNPITYCFMNANFIQSFRQTFGCPRRRPNYSFRSGYDSSFKSATAFTHTHLRVNADQPITMTQLRPNQRCPSVRHSPRTPTRHAQRQLTLSCGQGPSTASRTHSTSFTNKLLTNGATPASQTRSSSL